MLLGVDYYPEQWDASLLEADLDTIIELGCNVIRIAEFSWHLMEKREGEFDFSYFDNRPLAKLRGHIKITDTSNQRKTKGKTLSAISVFFGKNTETFYKAYSMLYINSLF